LRTTKLWNQDVFALPLKADTEKASKHLQMEFINLQCSTSFNKLQDFYSFVPKEKFIALRFLHQE
jgi:hypothetical protein